MGGFGCVCRYLNVILSVEVYRIRGMFLYSMLTHPMAAKYINLHTTDLNTPPGYIDFLGSIWLEGILEYGD